VSYVNNSFLYVNNNSACEPPTAYTGRCLNPKLNPNLTLNHPLPNSASAGLSRLRLLLLMCSFAQGFPVTNRPLIHVLSTPPLINVFFCAGISRDQPPSSVCTRRAPGIDVLSTPPLINVFVHA
jgi:hypothetical protein